MTLRKAGLFLFASIVAVLFLACEGANSTNPTEPTGTTGPSSITAEAFLSTPPENALLLDVRSEGEFSGGHIEAAINIPHDQLASRLSELEGGADRPVVVYCERGGRANNAADVLTAAGYAKVIHLEGDMSAWRAAGRPLVRP